MKKMIIGCICLLVVGISVNAATFEKDTIKTSDGDLVITFIGHGTLMMEFNEKVIHIDPVGMFADYSALPKADMILVTHSHGDHLDVNVIKLLKKEATFVVMTESCKEAYPDGLVLKNGDSVNYFDIDVDAVPAYNIKHERSEGNPFHPKGEGNGYVLHFGDTNVYVAGDTENIPEMADLKNIDVAFLPMNLPYTMTPDMAADAARMFMPKILYPYHFGETDTGELVELLKTEKEIEVRIRELK
ncbi:MBL fold metallo-hydrolase [Maribellus comscasis]|uniref:MBL fold metallo-hydrolase n=1 Tax=Maribellus comscasis TaxID=2681766 RepID=A0A6I6JN41_9BACT|nr:MBL fold metallo-hydrolase [Maribellus comscasis]QGY44376.1 MBL fold metallo-hydrolase [Maribellus comscasis]